MSWLFAPGFFGSGPVHTALVTGLVMALVSGVVGVLTVLRGQSFAGHALSDLGTLGGAGSYLMNVGPFWGYAVTGIVVGGVMELFGVQRRRGRDVATGIVLGAALGLSALFLYFDTNNSNTTGVTTTILFGSLFATGGVTVPAMIGLGLLVLVVVALMYRPLLLSSISADLAAARGIPVRVVGLVFLMLMGLAVALSSVGVGTILSPALLIGPAAVALRLTRRPTSAMAIAGVLGTLCTWVGIVLAYDSYHWPPVGRGWPVSFFVVTLIFGLYLLSDLGLWVRGRRVARSSGPARVPAGVG